MMYTFAIHLYNSYAWNLKVVAMEDGNFMIFPGVFFGGLQASQS